MTAPATAIRPVRVGLALALLLLAGPLEGQQRQIHIRHMEVQYNALRSGRVEVTETFRVRFDGQWNGLERVLEARAARADGGTRRVDLDVRGASDGDGDALRTETDRSGSTLTVRVWVPGARDADRTVVLRYRIDDGITFFDDHDEFYWNVTGQDWRVPIDSVDAYLVGPAAPDTLRVFAGSAGSRERRAAASQRDGVARFTSTAALPAGAGMTIAAWWPRGTFERPGAGERAGRWLILYGPLLLPLLAFGFMWRRWDRHGRDPRRLPITTRYEPPDRLTPGEIGVMLDESADMRDVTATLVDLAVRGHIRIEEVEGTKLLGMSLGQDYRFVRQRAELGEELNPHERLLLDALFEHGRSSVELSDLKNEFYKDLPGIRNALMDTLVGHGYYAKRPDKQRLVWLGIAGATFALMFPVGGWMAMQGAVWAPLALPLLTALPVAIFGWFMPARTMRGTRVLERALGFREFLSRVDGDRLRRMSASPELFEKGLPFAMAMGEEKRWASAFEGIYREPPRWYVGHHAGHFSPTSFVSDLGSMSTRAASAMSSSPGGSGGSGFSGGGSVGGGGGGGGGGGF